MDRVSNENRANLQEWERGGMKGRRRDEGRWRKWGDWVGKESSISFQLLVTCSTNGCTEAWGQQRGGGGRGSVEGLK